VIVKGIHYAGFLGIGIFLVLFLDGLHQLIQLPNLLICMQSVHAKNDLSLIRRTAHLINLSFIHPVTFPGVTLEGLGV
jgi:hypothetical protein